MNLYVNVVIATIIHRNKREEIAESIFFFFPTAGSYSAAKQRGKNCFGDIKRYENINGIK